MSNTKKTSNELKLVLYSAIIGAVAGIVFWLFLLAVNKGTWLIWEMIPNKLSAFYWYPIMACTAGGLIIGIFRKAFGDYPEDMMTVFSKLKKDKSYPYRNIPVILIAALLPLIFGSSVGPEAGMVGIIVALCCWAGDNLKFAGSQSAYYSKVGAAVSLSVMFRSPLFGILNVEEGIENDIDENMTSGDKSADKTERLPVTKLTKIIVYCVAAGTGFGCFWLMNSIFGEVLEGFPTFDVISLQKWDYILFIFYLICGVALGLFFEYSEKVFEKVGKALPPVLRELIAGVIFGAVACLVPVIRFSGEEQMGILISDFAKYSPLAMIGIAFLKIVMTNMCIQMGLKGGHFFPLIFAAVCLGFGLSLMIFPDEISHATYAAAIVAAGTLGVTLKKPLAVSMLLLLCFPAKTLLWITPSAAISAWISRLVGDKTEFIQT